MGGTLHLHQATSSYLILPQSIRGEACEFTSSSALASVSVALASPCIDMENCMSEPLSAAHVAWGACCDGLGL